MEITNIFNFESKIDYLIETDNSGIENKLKDFGTYMNSSIANANFETIEDSLNLLYERIRILEECIDYAKKYINSEIDETIAECKGLLNDLENMNDMNFSETKSCVIKNVPLVKGDFDQHTDRDGSILKPCEVYGNVVSLTGTVRDSIVPKNISILGSDQVYERNQEDLLADEVYRSHYLLDSVPAKGVTENITFSFDGPKAINSIKIKLSNCTLMDIIYIHEDNTETYATDTTCNIVPKKMIKAIKIQINSKNYTHKTVNVTATEADSVAKIDKAWQEVIQTIKESDIVTSQSEYRSTMSEYLESIYLKKEV